MKSISIIFVLLTLITASMSTVTKLGTTSLHWIPAHDGYIPNDAITVGVNNGKNLYFARGIVN